MVYIEIEKDIVGFWQDVLKLKDLLFQENFFDLGGYLLKVIQLVLCIVEYFNINICMMEIIKVSIIFE